MPVINQQTGLQQFYISDLVTDVILGVENRTTDTARAAVWLKDSLIEITTSTDFRQDFSELEVLGPLFNLTAGVQEFAESNFVAPKVGATPADLNMATLDIFIWQDYPANLQRVKLEPSHYQQTDKSTPVQNTRPSEWYRFGGNIGFYPIPDKQYQVQARCLRYHPINWAGLGATLILLPYEWLEILKMSAIIRGFNELEEYEKAENVHTILFGDPKYPARPGLIAGRKNKREREAWRSQGALKPRVRRYTFGGRR